MTVNIDEKSRSSGQPSWWWVLFPAGLSILCVVLILLMYHYRDLYMELRDDYRSQTFRSRNLENDCRRYRDLLADYEHPPLQLEPTMTALELTHLRKKGLEDPYAALAEDLVGNPHIEEMAHGEVDFTDVQQVCILSPNRAVARYEGLDDSGTALLEYRVDERGAITWRLLERLPLP